MDINIKLFKLLKIHDWDNLKTIINNTKDIDLNIRDNSQNYLIQYAILYNKIDIVNILINKGCRIDVLDNDGRTILFHCIKYNYVDIIDILLNYENNNIGISISELSDNNGYYPIHYAIIFKNLDVIKLFEKYNKSFNALDLNHNMPLHLAVKSKDINIFNKVLSISKEINFQTLQGETALHMACNFTQKEMIKILVEKNIDINIQDYETQITSLMYTVILSDYESFDILLDKSNLELQDINGNTIIHYCIIEKNYHFIDKIIQKNINLNISNIYGETALHMILENLIDDESYMDKFNLGNIIKETNLNIQDNKGNSCFYLICKTNLWKKIKSILVNKKINYMLKNNDGISPISFIKEEDINNFYLIIAASYVYQIRKSNNPYIEEIYNICKNELSYKNFENIKDNFEFKELINKLKKSDNDVCNDLIFNLIKNKKLTYPEKIKNYCIDLDEYKKDVDFITYTGTTLDILFGLILISKIHENILTTLTNDFQENSDLERYYINKKNRRIRKEDLINFEIIWDSLKIFYPTNFDNTINIFKSNSKYKYLIIPLGIELENGSHANILFYDKINNEVERFEPNGCTYPFKFNYNSKLLDSILKKKFSEIFPNCKYIYPKDFLPKIGFQLLESYNHYKTKKIGDPGGFCAVWCIWYINMRLKYTILSREKLVIKLIQKIKQENISFKNLIRNFAQKIIILRDEILELSNLDINQWINSTYEHIIYENLIINIKKMIISLIK